MRMIITAPRRDVMVSSSAIKPANARLTSESERHHGDNNQMCLPEVHMRS